MSTKRRGSQGTAHDAVARAVDRFDGESDDELAGK